MQQDELRRFRIPRLPISNVEPIDQNGAELHLPGREGSRIDLSHQIAPTKMAPSPAAFAAVRMACESQRLVLREWQ